MPAIEFGCRATAIGSMPHKDPQAACRQVLDSLRDIPAWPQLPKRGFRENMYAQYSQGFPGVLMHADSLHVDRAKAQDEL